MNYNLCLHADANDPAIIKLVLKNATNYLNALPGEKVELVIVANGPAVKLFTTESDELCALAKPLMDRGVKVRLCKNAAVEHKLDTNAIWPGVEIVPAGLVEVVRLQREGFAYIKP